MNDRPPWVVDQSEDQFGDAASILAKQAGNAALSEFADAIQGQSNRMVENPLANGHRENATGLGRLPATRKPADHADESDYDQSASDDKQQPSWMIVKLPR